MAGLSLFQLCETVLEYAAISLDSLPEEDDTLLGAPTRRFVAPGLVEVECCTNSRDPEFVQGQLSVHVEQLTESVTSPNATPLEPTMRPRLARVNQPVIVVMIARCSPSGSLKRPPTAAEWSASARQIQSDAWAIWNGLYRAQRDDDAFALFCDGMTVQPANSIPPEGGCVGFTFLLLPVMQGYNPLNPVA